MDAGRGGGPMRDADRGSGEMESVPELSKGGFRARPADPGCGMASWKMLFISLLGITDERWVDLRFWLGFTMGEFRTRDDGLVDRCV